MGIEVSLSAWVWVCSGCSGGLDGCQGIYEP